MGTIANKIRKRSQCLDFGMWFTIIMRKNIDEHFDINVSSEAAVELTIEVYLLFWLKVVINLMLTSIDQFVLPIPSKALYLTVVFVSYQWKPFLITFFFPKTWTRCIFEIDYIGTKARMKNSDNPVYVEYFQFNNNC